MKETNMTSAQIREVILGTISGVDTSTYDNPSYSELVMEIIRKSLEQGINLTTGFRNWNELSDRQLKCIKRAVDYGLNVKCMLHNDFTEDQLNELIRAMKSGIDPTSYASPSYDVECMREYTCALDVGVDITVALDPRLNSKDLKIVLKALMTKQAFDESLIETLL